MVNLADTVTHARFVGSDASSDKVVLMKILDVLDVLIISKVTQDLLKPVWHFPPSQVGLMLTNKSICEIMQSSLRTLRAAPLGGKRPNTVWATSWSGFLYTRLPSFSQIQTPLLKKFKMRSSADTKGKRKGRSKR